jgi:TPP-dependent pyruvate/acetoin dehydrogenase alpha subunit
LKRFFNDLGQSNLTGSFIDLDSSLNIEKREKSDLLIQFRKIYIARIVEIKIAQMREVGLIGGPVHLGAGQEAIAVGISKFLSKSDLVFSGHRSHAHLLALGADPRKLFAEILGKSTGFTKGMGGSMHLWDAPNGFYGSVPIVAGTVSLAVGAALASRLQNKNNIAVAYFGDGAVEEGVLHESLNLARQLEVPILFVCENNLFSSHMHVSQRQPNDSMARFAFANEVRFEVVDGNNLIAVEDAAEKLINLARSDNLPGFIEAFTYRHYGHVDWREDVDVGVNRSAEDLLIWKKRDPLNRLESALLDFNILTQKDISSIKAETDLHIQSCWDQAIADPEPELNTILLDVYKR